MRCFPIFLFVFIVSTGFSQESIHLKVNASNVVSVMPPIWRDNYEVHLLAGYGQDPRTFGTHQQFIIDPLFQEEMSQLKPRFIRVSLGRMDNPPDTNYFSTDKETLRKLPYEFYTGRNTLAEANDTTNYNFIYIDSILRVIKQIGAEALITMDYMPFNLSSDTIPEYSGLLSVLYYLGYNNSIRNAPPRDNAVYGRVMYHLIKHCYIHYGVRYFEHWNEPDQQWLNPVFAHFFWTGDEYQLYNAYKAIAGEVSADSSLADQIKLGGCSFAFYSLLNLVPTRFLDSVKINKDKFDFLSFHPYSDTQWQGGYDSAKVILATTWRDQYVPHAELINAEWGRIDPGATILGDLDYGLFKCNHIIDMLDRGILISNEVSIFDAVATSDNYGSIGKYRVGPISPKPTAFVSYNMNLMNDALNRLQVNIDSNWSALAGKSNDGNKIVIILPASKPESTSNTINLAVKNLTWPEQFSVKRYELTEQSYQQGIVYNLTFADTLSGDTYTDMLTYPAIDSSGRLIIWELSRLLTSDSKAMGSSDKSFFVYPNPTNGLILFSGSINVEIYDSEGKCLGKARNVTTINLRSLPNGVYYLHLKNKASRLIQIEKVLKIK